MDTELSQSLEAVEEAIDRAAEKNYSRQPRFGKDPDQFYYAVYRWVKEADLTAPDYSADSRRRDKWLRQFWPREPHLAGVVNSVVGIDKNRGWSLTGGRNQVYRYTRILHGYEAGKGWRYGFGLASSSFYTSDINAVVELGREGRSGPLRALYHADPALCQLTPSGLTFHPASGAAQKWVEGEDYFRCAALPSTDETFYGLGLCAVSRALELAKLMVAVYLHDQEQMGARAPRGLLLLKGISESQWNTAMQNRDEALTAAERKYYGGVAVLATQGLEDIDAKLVALSQLPAGFDRKEFIDLLMYGYALAFGYDPSEFWPVQFGSLGRGNEAEAQHRKASGKGGMDFVLAFQEQMQQQLPETVQFEFDSRDSEGELVDAGVAAAWADVAAVLAGGSTGGIPLIDASYIPQFLVEKGVIPPEWTAAQENVEAEDTDAEDAAEEPAPAAEEQVAEEALQSERVRAAMDQFPGEEIVRYSWRPDRPGRLRSIWKPDGRKLWAVGRRVKNRQDEGATLYADPDGEFTITEGDVTRAVAEGGRRVSPEFAELLDAPEVEA
jgi:hypothetical protein